MGRFFDNLGKTNGIGSQGVWLEGEKEPKIYVKITSKKFFYMIMV